MSTTVRYLLLVFGVVISFPLFVLLWFVPRTPVSLVGTIYLLSYTLMILGMVPAPWQARYSGALISAGVFIAFLTIAVRLLFPPSGTRLNLMTLPGPSSPRLLNRILDEQDVVLFGTQITPYLGAVSQSEKQSLDLEFPKAFQEMRLQGAMPLSPFLTTYLNQQSPQRFDVIVAEPASSAVPNAGVIFLHGFGGNFSVQCWLIARAVEKIDAVTVCPSTSVSGAWWLPQGRSILNETLAYLHGRGVKRIYLAGLSNGGIGASRLAASLREELAGLILISGADPGAAITDLPVLVLHGKRDERIPVSRMEGYASAAGSHATYHLFESDHFLLLKEADRMQEAIVDWLRQQEATSP